jgi:GAF domain-containing protein/HAMP domain-containing protein
MQTMTAHAREQSMPLALRTRLLLGLGLALCLLSLAGAFLFWQLSLLRQTLDSVDGERARLTLALDVDQQVTSLVVAVQSQMETESERLKETIQPLIGALASQRERLYDEAARLDPQDPTRQSLEKLAASLDNVIRIGNELVQAAQQARWEEVRAHDLALSESYGRFRSNLDRLIAATSEALAAADALAGAVTNRLLYVSIPMIGLAILVTATLGPAAVYRLVRGIERLDAAAQKLAEGRFDERVPTIGMHELGTLADSFNAMARELQGLYAELGRRVEERTQRLDAVAEVSRAATVVLDPQRLIWQVVELVRDRFGLYYVGLFLLDESGRFAVLRAGTGRAGRRMIEQGHRLEVGGSSMIGQCVARNEAGVQLDVGETAVRFDNPLLPATRSELALPLRSRGQVIGALTVQSKEETAFDQADIAALQTMADQVAVAIDNARLLTDAQAAIQELEAAQLRYLGQAWQSYVRHRTIRGYARTSGGMVVLDEQVLPEVRQAVNAERAVIARGQRPWFYRQESDSSRSTEPLADPTTVTALVTPITYQSHTIGAMGVRDPEGSRMWTEADIEMTQAISEQFAQAAENLRLIENTQHRESLERVTREMTEDIRTAVSVQDAVQRTLSRLGEAIGGSDWVASFSEADSDDGANNE